MSILNVSVSPDCVRVGTDTAAVDRASGVIARRTKAMLFDRCIIAGRGDLDLLAFFSSMHLGMPFEWDIERMRKGLEGRIDGAAAALRKHRDHGPVDRAEIVVAGWADMYSEPRAYCATVELDGTVTVERIRECYWGPAIDDLPPIGTAGEMKAATASQIEASRAKDPNDPIGGEFIVHELTGFGANVRRMGRIG